ncbi:hypothetical protein WN51_06355 [Melipona quadrifasciata]|uniref:Uncharacterized protein n=1 Tax=Melipona quadrifasciata TaxID=166423 RepID=A0A0M8ZR05_9HYME|nr:hypothetical protein WN51_06355 [Melipona quadrifasciata]
MHSGWIRRRRSVFSRCPLAERWREGPLRTKRVISPRWIGRLGGAFATRVD